MIVMNVHEIRGEGGVVVLVISSEMGLSEMYLGEDERWESGGRGVGCWPRCWGG